MCPFFRCYWQQKKKTDHKLFNRSVISLQSLCPLSTSCWDHPLDEKYGQCSCDNHRGDLLRVPADCSTVLRVDVYTFSCSAIAVHSDNCTARWMNTQLRSRFAIIQRGRLDLSYCRGYRTVTWHHSLPTCNTTEPSSCFCALSKAKSCDLLVCWRFHVWLVAQCPTVSTMCVWTVARVFRLWTALSKIAGAPVPRTWLKAGVGVLFIITGRINCGLSLAGRK